MDQQTVLKNLQKILTDQQELIAALPRAIRIMEIWPEAFENENKCKPVLVGIDHPRRPAQPAYPAPYEKVRSIKRTYLKREDGVEKDITEAEFFSIINAGP
jgi:hypothetical protein